MCVLNVFLQDDFDEMKILVLTEHDDCCGPMAAAFLRDYSQKIETVSAGIFPAENIQPLAVAAMKECLVDLSGTKPNGVRNCIGCDFDFILIIGDQTLVSRMNTEVFNPLYPCNPCSKIFLNPEIKAVDMDSMRQLRDWIKNEVFIVYKTHLH